MKYCKVLIPINSDNEFVYSIPEILNDIKIGSIVIVDFRSKDTYGIVMGFVNNENIKSIKNIKDIKEKYLKNPIDKKYIDLIKWMSDYYFTSKGNVFRNFFPSIRKNVKRYIYNSGNEDFMMDIKNITLSKAISKTDIKKIIKKKAKFEDLLKNGNIVESIDNYIEIKGKNIILNKEQTNAYKKVNNILFENQHKTFLLSGIPASGKSEVYIKLIKNTIENSDKSVLLLLPEIGLAQFVYDIIRKRFGTYITAIIHSELSDGEKYFFIKEINENRKRIIVGTRSAVFAPINNLGLIIVDEEQDMSYKQDAMPYYNGRDTAIYLAYKNKIPAVLCSATPSLETYLNVIEKKYELLELTTSFSNAEKPSVEILYDNRHSISTDILDALNKTKRDEGQSLIFLNRRGYLNVYKCEECGEYFRCDNCSVSYSFHKNSNEFICHYCGTKKPAGSVCPKCGGKLISSGVYGTEKIEEILKKLYPDFHIERMDLDSTMHKGERKRIIDGMVERKIDILIGTQMISKGYDIPNVNTVIIFNADAMINMPDIRSEERFMQLLIQTAGRAGRRDKRGKIIIESGESAKALAQFIYALDYIAFMKYELEKRKSLHFPPYRRMLRIIIKDKVKNKVIEKSKDIFYIIDKIQKKRNIEGLDVFPPVPAIIEKLNKTYRYNIFIFYNRFIDIKYLLNNVKKIRNDFIIDNDTL